MGNEQSRKASSTPNVEIELNHSRIHFIKVINDSRQRYMQAIFSTQKNDYIKWATILMTKKPNSNHLLLPTSYEYQAGQFCGTSGQAKVNYDNYPYLLQQQIENRRHKKRRFDETQLWLLLYCLLEAQKQMRVYSQGQQGIGDVRPQNIFLNQQGLMKVACSLSWPKQSNNYQKFLENQVTYLAPQDLPLLEQQNVDNSENKQSETFSIGLTILSAANLTSYNNLYSLSSKKFKTEEFINVLNQWRLNEYYSDIFRSTLASMLEVDLSKRIEQKVVFQWIEHYRENILARKDFVINDPPQAIINEVEFIKCLFQTVMASKYGGMSRLQGSRKLVGESKQFVSPIIPPPMQQQTTFSNPPAQSVYTSDNKNTNHLSNYLLQGAPIATNPPVFNNRTSVPTLYSETKTLTESVYTRQYSSVQKGQQPQGNTLLSMGKMNFEYNTFGQQPNQPQTQKIGNQNGEPISRKGTQKKITNTQQQTSNQPEIIEDSSNQQSSQKRQQYD